jgi:hypothetical protein
VPSPAVLASRQRLHTRPGFPGENAKFGRVPLACGSFLPPENRVKYSHFCTCMRGLPWSLLSFSPSWCWSPWCGYTSCSIGHGQATVPLHNRPPLHSRHPGASVAASPNPLWASPQSRTTTPVSTSAPLAHRHPHARHPAWSLCGGDDARSTPRRTSARTRTVPTGAGSDGAISAPMAIPVAVPGGNCCASPATALFSRPSARSLMANALPSSSSCASSRAWL